MIEISRVAFVENIYLVLWYFVQILYLVMFAIGKYLAVAKLVN